VNLDIENMTLTEKADAAFRQAAAKVIERARQTGTPVILWENGRVVKRLWDELIGDPTNTPNEARESRREDGSESAAGHVRGETAQERTGEKAS
jgi:hypothetical protein